LRAEWFQKTVPSSPNSLRLQAAQDEAVDCVKLLVKTLAKQYQVKIDANNPPLTLSSPALSQPIHCADSISRLASICDVPANILAAAPSLTAAQKLEDELSRYFEFEGSKGDLWDPLGWWKVHYKIYLCSSSLNSSVFPVGECTLIPGAFNNGLGLSCNSGNECIG
jgi:predicted RNA polymerase sigma factor